MVTGATGYVAGWLVKRLLEEGLTVHAAVRNPDKKEKTQHLDSIAEKASGSIKYFKSDLLDQGSYAEAMEGCQVVFHTASPFTISVEDAQRDLIDPAVNGTRNVLEQANKTESVKRVVVTSSCAAIYTDAAECANYPNGEIIEEIWNTTSSTEYQPYSYSKTLAEKEAWKIAEAQDRWKLVTINPSFVMGPFLNPKSTTSESFNIMKQMGDGDFKSGVPNMGIGIVDVRDVADAHFLAGFKEDAQGRHITSAHNSGFLEMAQILHKHYGDKYPIPNKALPKWLVVLMGPLLDKKVSRKMLRNNVNHTWKANNSKIKEELGVSFRPLESTLTESFQVLVDNNVVTPKK